MVFDLYLYCVTVKTIDIKQYLQREPASSDGLSSLPVPFQKRPSKQLKILTQKNTPVNDASTIMRLSFCLFNKKGLQLGQLAFLARIPDPFSDLSDPKDLSR